MPDATETAVLTALANGIIPADARDAGAAAVNAGPRLAERMRSGVNTSLYEEGLRAADDIARERFARPIVDLNPTDLADLLDALRTRAPGFFARLRMDVCGLYMSDPDVWRRIGFPGPSIETGGYPDFDRPQ